MRFDMFAPGRAARCGSPPGGPKGPHRAPPFHRAGCPCISCAPCCGPFAAPAAPC